jgi:uncharacterized surface anchored protein
VLAGALLQLIDSEGYVIDEWHSSNSFKLIEGLNPQVSYKLRCVTAPDAYVLPEDVLFSIDADGKITSSGAIDGEGTLLIEFSKTEFFVSAVDLNGVELEGALLQILDSNGVIVDEWHSTDSFHRVDGLKTQVEYTLFCTVAPDGYIIPTEQYFAIAEDGKVTYTGSVREDGTLLVEFSETEVYFSAVEKNGNALQGATLQILDSDRCVVAEWVSFDTADKVSQLHTGMEYILRCVISPEGYTLPEDVTFSIDAQGKVIINEEHVDVVEICLAKSVASVSMLGVTVEYSTVDAALEGVEAST